jgi:hypothetical protein
MWARKEEEKWTVFFCLKRGKRENPFNGQFIVVLGPTSDLCDDILIAHVYVVFKETEDKKIKINCLFACLQKKTAKGVPGTPAASRQCAGHASGSGLPAAADREARRRTARACARVTRGCSRPPLHGAVFYRCAPWSPSSCGGQPQNLGDATQWYTQRPFVATWVEFDFPK